MILMNIKRILESAVALFVVSLTLRALYLWLASQNFTSDEYWFKFNDTVHFANVAQGFRDGFAAYEDSLILVGPGYGFVLFIQDMFVGANAWANLTVTLLMSSLNCLLVRSLALRLGLARNTAALAGYICAFSLSAISFSSILYSETVFTLVTLLTVHSFLRLAAYGRLSDGLAFASLCVSASLIRSVGQFYPLVFGIVLGLWLWREKKDGQQSARRLNRIPSFAYVILAVALIAIWPLRNYAVHGVFTISETGTRAARDYWIAATVADIHGEASVESIDTARALWEKQLRERYNTNNPTIQERHEFDLSVIRDTISAYPLETITSYLGNVWTSVTSQSYLQRSNVPQLMRLWNFYSRRIASHLGVFLVALNFLGLYLIFRRGLWKTAALLAVFYVYLALIIGASFWQGSRLFLPAQPFWAISCSFALVWLIENSRNLLTQLRSE